MFIEVMIRQSILANVLDIQIPDQISVGLEELPFEEDMAIRQEFRVAQQKPEVPHANDIKVPIRESLIDVVNNPFDLLTILEHIVPLFILGHSEDTLADHCFGCLVLQFGQPCNFGCWHPEHPPILPLDFLE